MNKHRQSSIFLIITVLLAVKLLAGCSSSANSIVFLSKINQTTTETPKLEIPPIITGDLKIAYLDVGQGDNIYITLPNSETVLIDAGESSASERVIQHIKVNNDKRTIDYVITAHPHSDHVGGIATVLESFTIKSMWVPNMTHITKTSEGLLGTIAAKGLKIQKARAGKILFDYGNLRAEFIAPNNDRYSDLNNYSVAVLLTYNDCRFLFMGDAEKKSESEILALGHDISSADILKIGHRGSSTSGTNAFIKAVSPKYAIISCGKGNNYGHPTAKTLATLSEFGIDVKRTDESGTIIFSCDGEKISYTTFQTGVQSRTPTYTPKEVPAETQSQSIIVYVTRTGTKYHCDGCRYLSKSKISMDLLVAKQKYVPCSVCNL